MTTEQIDRAADTAKIKSLARYVKTILPASLLASRRRTIKGHTRTTKPKTEPSYEGLSGEWADWYKTAKCYESKALTQDREDVRHDIILELADARKRDGQPIPQLRQYRIASLMIALYWRKLHPADSRVCLYYGAHAIKPRCDNCTRPGSEQRPCPYKAYRPNESLEREFTTDTEGERLRLLDIVQTESVLDLPAAWTELNTWLLGFPARLVEIAGKRLDNQPLDVKDRMYLTRFWKTHQKRLV
jgi:hypothetical protein